MNKRYYEIEIFGDEFKRLKKGLYPTIAQLSDEYNREYLWITSNGKFISREEWPEGIFFSLDQEAVWDTCLYNTESWLLFSNELCNNIRNAGITGLQFLPIKIYDMEGKIVTDYTTVINVDNTADCMDLEKSVYTTHGDFFGDKSDNPENNKIIEVKKYVLNKEKLPDTNIFMLKSVFTYITDEKFVKLFESHEYSGLSFKEVEII